MGSWVVSNEEAGKKLLAFLKEKLPTHLSAKQIKKAIEENHCSINNNIERFASHALKAGDSIQFNEAAFQQPQTPHAFETKRILYEDSFLIIYNKPAKTVSDDPKFIQAIQRELPFLAPVHRLDKDTTGALILAKSKEVLEAMIQLFRQHLIKKGYLALVDKTPIKHSGKIDNYLAIKHRYEGQAIWGAVPASKGVQAITEWVCERKAKDAALLKCLPKTGRTHQIRVHLSEMGHPILGDYQYGRNFHCHLRPDRYLLHAETLQFSHPISGQPIVISAELPDDFKQAILQIFGS